MIMKQLMQDLPRNRVLQPGRRDGVARTVLTLRFAAVAMFRASQILGERSGLLGGIVKQVNQLVTGTDVAWQAKVGPGLVLMHPAGVVIGPGAVMGGGNVVQQGVTIGGHGLPRPGEDVSPTVGDNVVFGAGARCIGAISIGNGALIGANAVVLIDVPPGATAVGVPARVITQDSRSKS